MDLHRTAKALAAGTFSGFLYLALASTIRRLGEYLSRVYTDAVYHPWFLGLGFEETGILVGLGVAAYVAASDASGNARPWGRAAATTVLAFILLTSLEDGDTARRLPVGIALFGGLPALAAGLYRYLADTRPRETAEPTDRTSMA